MKYKTLSLCLGLFALASSSLLCAADAEVVEEKVIPTEISEPPYEVGDLVVEQGYYIERGEDATRINLRIVDNSFRLYWIDADGLIAEPEAKVATVHLQGSFRGLPYHRLEKLPDDAGLGAQSIVLAPHIYNLILAIEDPAGGEPSTYRFRYTSDLDVPVDPTTQASGGKPKAPSKY